MSAVGWIATFVVVAVQMFWFVLYRVGAISNYVGIGLLLLTCGLAIWLMPYVAPARLAPPPEPGR